MTSDTKNEGEGNRSAAREYNKETQEFVEKEDVGAKARDAQDAVDNDDAGELADAEKTGESKARQ